MKKHALDSVRLSLGDACLRAAAGRRAWPRAVAAIAMLLLAGCGAKENGAAVHPVSGKVTHRGQPAAGARLIFVAVQRQDDKTPIPTAVADADGSFRVTSYQSGDGAPAGQYAVTVVWHDPPPPGVNPESYSPRDKLGGRYSSPERSPLKATVAEGENELPPFDLQ